MRKQWSVAAAVLIAFFSVLGAAAQAPQGAGAEKGARELGCTALLQSNQVDEERPEHDGRKAEENEE